MWEAYAGAEGVAVRTTFQDLQEAIRSVAETPITFGQVEYVNLLQDEGPRFGWAPLFHKRIEYRGEERCGHFCPGRLGKTASPIRKYRIFGSIRTFRNSEADTYLWIWTYS